MLPGAWRGIRERERNSEREKERQCEIERYIYINRESGTNACADVCHQTLTTITQGNTDVTMQ